MFIRKAILFLSRSNSVGEMIRPQTEMKPFRFPNQSFLPIALVLWCCHHAIAGQNHLRRPVAKKLIASPQAKTTDGRIIYFQHIHKSGGSTMCRIAALNHMKTALKTNCNVQEDQRCCGGSDSLTALQRFAETTPYSFVANEGTFDRSIEHQWSVTSYTSFSRRYVWSNGYGTISLRDRSPQVAIEIHFTLQTCLSYIQICLSRLIFQMVENTTR